MKVKLGYCIHCGQANITCINTQPDGTLTHYDIVASKECGPLMIDDVEIPEPHWPHRPVEAKAEAGELNLQNIINILDEESADISKSISSEDIANRILQLARPAPAAIPEGLREAFLHGAKWWEFESTKGTMWGSDQDKVWAEAERRYPASPPAEPGLRELLKAADDLCFECDGVLQTKAPSMETYNRAYLVIKAMKDMLDDAALRGEVEPTDPDMNADGPAERAHRQDEARRSK